MRIHKQASMYKNNEFVQCVYMCVCVPGFMQETGRAAYPMNSKVVTSSSNTSMSITANSGLRIKNSFFCLFIHKMVNSSTHTHTHTHTNLIPQGTEPIVIDGAGLEVGLVLGVAMHTHVHKGVNHFTLRGGAGLGKHVTCGLQT
jgi:hypothetical protein